MLAYEEQKKAALLYRKDKKTLKDIAKVLQVTPGEVKEGVIEFERQHKIKARKQADVGDIIDYYANGGIASGEVIKVNTNSVIINVIDMENMIDGLEGKTVVSHKRYRVVDVKKLLKVK